MSDSIFGGLVLGTDVGNAVIDTLQLWMDTYLALISRYYAAQGINIGALPSIGSYVFSSDPNHFPEEAPPAVLVAVPNTLDLPIRDGSRNYRTKWDVRVIDFVQGPDRDSTERLAMYYGAAIRLIMLQKGSLGNFAQGTKWRGEYYGTRVADRDQRTLGSCENQFSVDVRDVVQALGGPTAPISTIPPDWPEVTDVIVNYQANALPEE